jgi:predicted nucleic acid-binding protein
MNIADSSVWIEHFSDGPSASIFLPVIEDRKNLIIPTIVLYEVHKWISIFQSEDAAKRSAAIMMRDRIVQLDPVLALEASRLSIKHKLPVADAIIYSTAVANAAEVWTTDGHFKDLPNVHYFEKS